MTGRLGQIFEHRLVHRAQPRRELPKPALLTSTSIDRSPT
jgi:hypothetical protein